MQNKVYIVYHIIYIWSLLLPLKKKKCICTAYLPKSYFCLVWHEKKTETTTLKIFYVSKTNK